MTTILTMKLTLQERLFGAKKRWHLVTNYQRCAKAIVVPTMILESLLGKTLPPGVNIKLISTLIRMSEEMFFCVVFTSTQPFSLRVPPISRWVLCLSSPSGNV